MKNKFSLLLVLLAPVLLALITSGQQLNVGKFLSITNVPGTTHVAITFYTEPAPTNTIILQRTHPGPDDDYKWDSWMFLPSIETQRLTNTLIMNWAFQGNGHSMLFRMCTNYWDEDWHLVSYNSGYTNSDPIVTNLPPPPSP